LCATITVFSGLSAAAWSSTGDKRAPVAAELPFVVASCANAGRAKKASAATADIVFLSMTGA
jgi:hypothetical protein